MPNKTNKRAILVKLESEYNASADTPTVAHQIRSVDVTPLAGNDIEREFVRPFYGNDPIVAGEKYAEITIEYEFASAGTAGEAPLYSPMLQACGFSEVKVASTSCTYAPVSENEASVVIFAHMDGNLHKLRGCRGSFAIKANADAIPTIEFKMMGLISPVTAAAIPTTAPSSYVYADPISTTNTTKLLVHGQQSTWAEFSLDAGVNTVHRKVVGNNDNVITDRAPTGTLNIEDPTVAVKDYFASSLTAALGQVKFEHGTTAGRKITLDMPSCSLGSPDYTDVDGIQHLQIAYRPTPVSGNDEIVLTYT